MSKKIRMTMQTEMTLEEGVKEFYLNCEARNLCLYNVNDANCK